jgi:hypothetical protein
LYLIYDQKGNNDMGIEDMSREDLEKAYLRAMSDRDFYKDKVDELTKKLARTHQLMTNTSVPPREKVVLYGLGKELETVEPREDGFSHVYRSKLASKYGLSPDAASDSMKSLSERGVIDRKVEPHRNPETGKPEKLNLVALGEAALHNPKAIDFSKDKNWGGKRIKGCQSCGGSHLQKLIHTQTVCMECGSTSEDWKTVNIHDDHTENNSVAGN